MVNTILVYTLKRNIVLTIAIIPVGRLQTQLHLQQEFRSENDLGFCVKNRPIFSYYTGNEENEEEQIKNNRLFWVELQLKI